VPFIANFPKFFESDLIGSTSVAVVIAIINSFKVDFISIIAVAQVSSIIDAIDYAKHFATIVREAIATEAIIIFEGAFKGELELVPVPNYLHLAPFQY
jgi:hypothetical protein